MTVSRMFLCLFSGGSVQKLPQGLGAEGGARTEVDYNAKRYCICMIFTGSTDGCYHVVHLLLRELQCFANAANLKQLTLEYASNMSKTI